MTRMKRIHLRRGRRSGFSRSEVIFLIGIILLAASIMLPAREFVRRWQRLVMARGDLRSIATAVRHYHSRYNLWPGQSGRQGGDIHYGPRHSNSEVMNVLRAVEGPGNPKHAANSNRVVFLDVAACGPGLSGLNSHGEFIDPWGSQYHIVLDLDYDNICASSDTIYTRIQGEGVIAWSNGPDGKSDTDDDLRSWKWILARPGVLPNQ